MKKYLAVILAALAIAVATPAHAAGWRPPLKDKCRFQFMDGHKDWSTKEVRYTIKCAVNRWPVPGGLTQAMYVANRESGYHQFAYNPSGCSGVYQWAQGTWSSVLNDFPPLYKVLGHSVWNARSNVMYAVKYAHNRGWGPWGF